MAIGKLHPLSVSSLLHCISMKVKREFNVHFIFQQCIYNHSNVAEKERSQRVFNSSFWVDASTRPEVAVVPPMTCHVKISVTSNRSDEIKLHEEREVSDPLLFKH